MFSIIKAAGWPIWPLILCSILAVALIIEKVLSLRRSRVAPPNLLEELMGVMRTALPSNDALAKLSETSVLGGVLAAGVRAVIAEPRLGEPGLRQALEIAGREAIHRLERFLNALGSIATIAPLLGLLGTVVGMIEIFGSQSPGGNSNPIALAHGISVALYNTAFGLIVAIPALLAHRYFRSVINDYRLTLELAAERLVPQLLRHGVGSAATAGVPVAPMPAASGAAAAFGAPATAAPDLPPPTPARGRAAGARV